MYGWKGRIGLLIPHRNTTMEPEFHRMIPKGVSVHTARMLLEEPSPNALAKMEEEIYRTAGIISAVDPDVIVVGCTSGSLIKGSGYDQHIIDKITDLTNLPAITTATAVIEALKRLNIRNVAVATPYIDEVNQKEKEFIEDTGISVTQIKGLGYCKPVESYPMAPRPVSRCSNSPTISFTGGTRSATVPLRAHRFSSMPVPYSTPCVSSWNVGPSAPARRPRARAANC